MNENITFYDHEIVQKSPNDYIELEISPDTILHSWRQSMFSCELLGKDGTIKSEADIKGDSLKRFLDMSETIKHDKSTHKPILGIGLMDNIEIGIGREIVVLCALHKIPSIPIHVRQAQAQEIKKILNI